MTESESKSPDSPPPDPSGIEEPHDVLAAEEFAMPAPDPFEGSGGRLGADPRVLVPLMLLLLLVLAGLRRRAG